MRPCRHAPRRGRDPRCELFGTGKVWVPRAACPPVPALAASCQWHTPFKIDQYQLFAFVCSRDEPAYYQRALIRSAIIFDLDGTITKPYLDFDAIRREIGIASGTILEAMAKMDGAARARAEEIVLRHEWEAARNGDIYDDAVEVLESCRANEFATAVLTRNAREVVDFLIERHKLPFDTIRTREDGAVKPSPEPVHSICGELKVDPRDSWMVGDFLYDIRSGRSAGTGTILMIGDGAIPEYAGQADFVIRRLREIPAILDFAEWSAA